MEASIPSHLYGTAWKEGATETCVTQAVAVGYRAFDTACQRKHYFEKGVGDALIKIYDDPSIGRDGIFLQTKFTHIGGQDHRLPYDPTDSVDKQVLQSFETSCQNLRTNYFDSYVLHGPNVRVGLSQDDIGAWQAMESLHIAGKVRTIGASNMSATQIAQLYEFAKVKPSFIQNRCYPTIAWDKQSRQVCKRLGITYQAFSVIRDPLLFSAPHVAAMADKYHKTIPQIIFRFINQVGAQILCGSQNKSHLEESLDIFDFELSPEEIHAIEDL